MKSPVWYELLEYLCGLVERGIDLELDESFSDLYSQNVGGVEGDRGTAKGFLVKVEDCNILLGRRLCRVDNLRFVQYDHQM